MTSSRERQDNMSEIEHGTTNGYVRRKCRCAECRAWNRDRIRRTRGYYPIWFVPTKTEPDASWMPRGKCRGGATEVFYPARGESADPAKEVCRGCPVMLRCLNYALLMNEEHGVWGGRSERQRRTMREEGRRDEVAEWARQEAAAEAGVPVEVQVAVPRVGGTPGRWWEAAIPVMDDTDPMMVGSTRFGRGGA